MKDIWFWISKDLAELTITAIIILIAIVWFGGTYFVNEIKRKIEITKRRKQKENK